MTAIRRASSAKLAHPSLALCALVVLLAGCSTPELANLPRTGLQDDGTYLLSEQEQGLGCRDLQERSLGLQEQMQALSVQALEQMQQLPGTAAAAWKRLVGAPEGVPAIAEYNEARAQSAALNQTMTRKGCDITTASIKR